ncbi:MAG TPA: ABC transporter permease subunit [Bacteroidia bacterium]|nr:ABC transporter permease subunit [Bacteroidia bacterium]
MIKIIRYVMADILRSRIIFVYTIFLLAISLSIFNLEDNPSKGLLSMLNIILIIVPLVSLIFSTIYMYNSAEFIELLLSQPVRRAQLLLSIYAGVCFSLLVAFTIGIALPIIIMVGTTTAYMMTAAGLVLTAVFVAMAVLGSVVTRDKAKGIGIAIMLWLYFSLFYDSFLLLIMFQFSDYPLEKPMIALCSLNPVDLARIFILLSMDISALMGYTGALFSEFFGTSKGTFYVAGVMSLWIFFPLFFAVRRFKRKDL